jgi:hypothetical protein
MYRSEQIDIAVWAIDLPKRRRRRFARGDRCENEEEGGGNGCDQCGGTDGGFADHLLSPKAAHTLAAWGMRIRRRRVTDEGRFPVWFESRIR